MCKATFFASSFQYLIILIKEWREITKTFSHLHIKLTLSNKSYCFGNKKARNAVDILEVKKVKRSKIDKKTKIEQILHILDLLYTNIEEYINTSTLNTISVD